MTRLEDVWDRSGSRPIGNRLLGAALIPGSWLYGAGVAARGFAYRRGWVKPEAAPIPVISVGGLEAGGVGKTPLALELARLALAAGLRPAILSRGYGRREATGAAIRVPDEPDPGDADRFGDEPVWLARRLVILAGADPFPTRTGERTDPSARPEPGVARSDSSSPGEAGAPGRAPGIGVWVSRRRIDAARAAALAGANLAILDDGLQHRSLHRDGEVVSLSGTAPFGNERLLPAGPLREPIRPALARADRLVLAGLPAASVEEAKTALAGRMPTGVPVFSWRSVPSLQPGRGRPPSPGEPVVLICGIAHPERLPQALGVLGYPLAGQRSFPDHHRFRRSDLNFVGAAAPDLPGGIPSPRSQQNATGRSESPPLVTTEKDWVRLEPILDSSARCAILSQQLVWNEPDAEADWQRWLRSVVGRIPRGA